MKYGLINLKHDYKTKNLDEINLLIKFKIILFRRLFDMICLILEKFLLY